MVKKLLKLIMVTFLLLPAGCSYDDTDLWQSVNDLDERVGQLEEQVKTLNGNVKTLSDLMNGKLFIQSIEDKGDGVRVINFINAAGEQSSMEVRNGKDGKDGQNGADGKDGINGTDGKDGQNGTDGKDGKDGKDGADGKDGQTPVVSIRQDSDGNWYWTVNGEFVLDASGNKVRANGQNGKDGVDGKDGQNGADGKDGVNGADGKDGKDGVDGKDGKDGLNGADGKDGKDGADGADGKDGVDGKNGEDAIAPAFRITNGQWEMSLDQGLTWVVVGQATGTDGDSFFSDAQTSADGKYAYLTLKDGTVLTFTIYTQFGISFDIAKTIIQEGQSRVIDFFVTGMTPETQVEAIGKNGWEAETELASNGKGKLTVTAPDKTGFGKVIVLLNDGGDRTIMRTLTILAGTVRASTSSVEVPSTGATQAVNVETNIDFTVNIPKEAQSWISLVESRATATHTETFNIKVEGTDSPSPRSALLSLEASDGTVVETILVVQTPVAFDAANLVFRVDPATSTNSKGVILPILAITAPVTIDWGDGNTTELTAALTSSTRYPSHKYEDTTHPYNVVVKGTVTSLNGTGATYHAGVTEIAQWGTGNAYTNVKMQNSNITYLPEVKGNEFAKVTSIAFSNNRELVNISPKLLKGATALKNANNLFDGCSSLKSIPTGLFTDLANVTSANYLFRNCSSLTDVPADFLKGLNKATSLTHMFYGCTSLKTVPSGALNGLPAVTNLSYIFNGCTSLEAVPADLFKGLTKLTTLQYFFYSCKALEELPENLFEDQKNTVNSMPYVLAYTENLKTVPANLFADFNKVTNIQYIFQKSGIEEIPAGFFDFATQVTNFQNAFDGCTQLRKIGSGFVNNYKDGYTGTSEFSFIAMFRDCAKLTDLPADMFNEETWKRVSNSNNMFAGCASLAKLPDNFFKGLGEGVKNNKPIKGNYNMMFSGCAKLQSVPMETFFNTPGGLQTTSFTQMFKDCKALSGTVPAYKLTVGDQTYNVLPWQRKEYITNSVPEIATAAKEVFGTMTNYSSSDCFAGASKVNSWATIPSEWGGGNDGITAKPEITIEVQHPEGAEYYSLIFDMYGKEVTTLTYYLSTSANVKKYLPRYNNSLEQMVREGGTKIARDDYQSHFYAQLNSETGSGLTFDTGDPETEYTLIVLVENSKGQLITVTKAATSAVPTGSDEYEAYLGTWTVTPAGTVVEMAGQDEEGNPVKIDTPTHSFDITIEPFRTDSVYTVKGWGYTKFANSELHATFNKETKAIEFWNGQKGNVQVMTNYPFGPKDNPNAQYSTYTVTYYGFVEDPKTYQYNFYSSSTEECILAGNLIPAIGKINLIGQKSSKASSPEYGDVYWSGLECLLCMRSMSGSQYWIPVQIIKPEYVFTYNGIDLTLHHHGPYTLTRAEQQAPAKAKAAPKQSGSMTSYKLNIR